MRKRIVKKTLIYLMLAMIIGAGPILLTKSVYSLGVNELMTSLGVTSLAEGKIAPGFTLKDLDGKKVSLSDYRGKLIFLNFWATWCPPCRREMPSMERLYQRFKDEDFVILAVDLREGKRVVEKFARKYKLNFPILLDSTGKTGDAYGIRAIPTTYFIDRQGKLIGKAVGARDWASKNAFELIEHLLEKPAPLKI